MKSATKTAKNILGTPLEPCCYDPLTGYLRDGYCHTMDMDAGTHVVCAVMTDAFLKFSAARGNDLITPRPQWNFPGLKAGDKWCLCVSRWLQAVNEGLAPKVIMEACHERALDYAKLSLFQKHAYQD